MCEVFVVAVAAFLFLSVFARSHWSTAFSKTSVFVRFFVQSSVNGLTKTDIFSPFLYKNGAVWTKHKAKSNAKLDCVDIVGKFCS